MAPSHTHSDTQSYSDQGLLLGLTACGLILLVLAAYGLSSSLLLRPEFFPSNVKKVSLFIRVSDGAVAISKPLLAVALLLHDLLPAPPEAKQSSEHCLANRKHGFEYNLSSCRHGSRTSSVRTREDGTVPEADAANAVWSKPPFPEPRLAGPRVGLATLSFFWWGHLYRFRMVPLG